ncbi:MAG: SDR family NAD(P)-dependent oxidoreductase [bacterium]|nr:SDR family NAD(P)-dependent oxidoreductase [bacterium]
MGITADESEMTPIESGMTIIPLAAKSESALVQMAGDYVAYLKAHPHINLGDLAYNLHRRRSHFEYRLAVPVRAISELTKALSGFASDSATLSVVHDRATVSHPKTAFIFTGMGPQWYAMGRALYENNSVYKGVFDDISTAFYPISGWSLVDELAKNETESRIGETQIAQPANFAFQVALSETLAHYGVSADMMMGHSVGEVSAAYLSGALNLHDALLVSYHRSRLQQTMSGGTMLAVGMSESEWGQFKKTIGGRAGGSPIVVGDDVGDDGRVGDDGNNKIGDDGNRVGGDVGYDGCNVDVAAVNSPTSITLAGDVGALNEIASALASDEVFHRFLKVDVAYHSYQMDGIRRDILDALGSISPQDTHVPLYSSVSGGLSRGRDWGNGYWWHNARDAVRFADGVQALIADGVELIVEVGPHPVLSSAIKECVLQSGKEVRLVHTLHRKEADVSALWRTLCDVFVAGYDLDWQVLHPNQASFLDLPKYPWQKAHYQRMSERSRQDLFGNPGPVYFHENVFAAEHTWQVDLNENFFPYVSHHIVQGNAVFPGAAYVAGLIATQDKLLNQDPKLGSGLISHIGFESFLAMQADAMQVLQTRYVADSQMVEMHSTTFVDGKAKGWTRHARGRVATKALERAENDRHVDLDAFKLGTPVQIGAFYARLADAGLDYGPLFQVVKDAYRFEDLIRVHLKAHPDMDSTDYALDPTLLDGAFHSILALNPDGKDAFVPIRIARLLRYGAVEGECWVEIRPVSESKQKKVVDMSVYGMDGVVLMELYGVVCQSLSFGTQTRLSEYLYEHRWKEELAPSSQMTQVDDGIVILANGASEQWIEHIVGPILDVGARAHVLQDNLTYMVGNTDLKVVLEDDEAIREFWLQQRVSHIIDLRFMRDARPDSAVKITDLLEDLRFTINYVLELGLPLMKWDFITHGAVHVVASDAGGTPGLAILSDALKVLAYEFRQQFECRVIDTDGLDVSLPVVLNALYSHTDHATMAVREGVFYARAFTRHLDKREQIAETHTDDSAVRLELKPGNTLDRVFAQRVYVGPPGPGEVQIKVQYSGLNEKDLDKILGVLSGEMLESTYLGSSIGMEISGTVVAVGRESKGLAVGDEVMAILPHGYTNKANVHYTRVILKPSVLTMPEAANLVPHMAAYRGLIDIANIKEGERVLIHNAAGAVGQAAIQLAVWRGAMIFATAGTSERRDYLRNMGISHVYDSRQLAFSSALLRDTGGCGVDVVLNATDGDTMQLSFDLLAPYGRFIEIGKKDISNNASIGLGAFEQNLLFASVDIDRLLHDKPNDAQTLMARVATCYERGILTPMPTAVVPAAEYESAFELLRDNQHIGKIVLNFENQSLPARPLPQRVALSGTGTYLVTGGTRGFGLATAKWLAETGARHLILASRSGKVSESELPTLKAIQATGALVQQVSVDVTDAEAVRRVVDMISPTMPLKGIIHGATSFDEDFILDLNRDKLLAAIAPKVQGVINIAEATRHLDLDFCVNYSSIAAVIGNQRQLAYVAGNSFLDNYATYNRVNGYPMVSINWGAVSDTGYVQRHSLDRYFETMGVLAVTSTQCMAALDYVLAYGVDQLVLSGFDWQVFSRLNQRSPLTALCREFVIIDDSTDTRDLRMIPDEARADFAQNALITVFAKKLKMTEEQVDVHVPISQLGVDSLTTLELAVDIEGVLGVAISSVELLAGPTILQIVASAVEKVSKRVESPIPAPGITVLTDDVANTTEESSRTDLT